MLKGKQQIFEKLEKYNESSTQPDDQELNLLIDSLRVSYIILIMFKRIFLVETWCNWKRKSQCHKFFI